MIRNVLIDLDDTILDFHKAEKIALSKTLSHFGIEPEERVLDRYHVLNIEQWKKLELGLITRDEVKVKRYEALFNEIGADCSPKAAAEYYESQLGIGHYFIDGAEELLKGICDKYNLYMVSNGTSCVQHSRIESAGIEKYFNEIFISEDIGFTKPSAEFFDYCFRYIEETENRKLEKDETVVVGDSLTSDILGGVNAGIRTVWFNPGGAVCSPDITPDFEIKTLGELPGLLGGIL